MIWTLNYNTGTWRWGLPWNDAAKALAAAQLAAMRTA